MLTANFCDVFFLACFFLPMQTTYSVFFLQAKTKNKSSFLCRKQNNFSNSVP